MGVTKVAITLEEKTLKEVDRLVRERRYPNRSRAVQAALEEMMRRRRRARLTEETAKLDVAEEQALAEEGVGDEAWAEY